MGPEEQAMSQIPCPQCGGLDWSVLNLCLGCIRKVDGRVTMQLHDCKVEPPATPKDGIIPIMTEIPEHLKGTELEPAMATLLDRQTRLSTALAKNRGAIAAMAALHPRQEGGRP